LIHEPYSEEQVNLKIAYWDLLYYERKMNKLLKNNAGKIQILYGISKEDVLRAAPIGFCKLYWSRESPNIRNELNLNENEFVEIIVAFREKLKDSHLQVRLYKKYCKALVNEYNISFEDNSRIFEKTRNELGLFRDGIEIIG
jgi:predicted polyphosphate/ATP-dependent NAD kinase